MKTSLPGGRAAIDYPQAGLVAAVRPGDAHVVGRPVRSAEVVGRLVQAQAAERPVGQALRRGQRDGECHLLRAAKGADGPVVCRDGGRAAGRSVGDGAEIERPGRAGAAAGLAIQGQRRGLDRLAGERAAQTSKPHAAVVPAQAGGIPVVRIHALHYVHGVRAPASAIGFGERGVLHRRAVRRLGRDGRSRIRGHARVEDLPVAGGRASARRHRARAEGDPGHAEHRKRALSLAVVQVARGVFQPQPDIGAQDLAVAQVHIRGRGLQRVGGDVVEVEHASGQGKKGIVAGVDEVAVF